MNGWMGNLLRVNLTDRTSSIESSEKYFKYIGGKGMANRIMYEEVPAGTEPASAENKIVFAAGPNTGASAPCSGRCTISTLSPFTKYNSIVDAHMGGDTATMLKTCGFDALIIEGASETPVYIYVNDDKVEIRDASDLWGKATTHQTAAAIAQATVPGVNVVSIGRAGENLLNLSCVITGDSHCGGGGLGKIFGSKKLKAVALYGTKGVQVADAKKVQELNKYVMSDLIGSNNNHVVPQVPQSFSEYSSAASRWVGRPGLTWGAAEGGPIDTGESAPGQPTLVGYRCQKAVYDYGAAAEKYTAKMTGCAGCPIRCYGSLNVPQMKDIYGIEGKHSTTCMPSYGFISSLVKNVTDKVEEGDGQIMAKMYCSIMFDELGMWENYGELGATIGYFMKNDNELMKKILTEAEYNAIDWSKAQNGDITFCKDIMECILDPNHSMNILGQGAYYVDQKHHDILGDEFLNSADLTLWSTMGSKRHHGNECAAQVGMLTNVIYNRDGMCHTIVNITGSGLPYALQKSIIEGLFGEGALDAPKNYTKMNEAKARFAKFGVVRQVLHDSFTLCNWVWPMTLSPRKERGYKGDLTVEAQYMSAITGEEWTMEELDFAAERVIQLHRAMTILSAGTNDMRTAHDQIPDYAYNTNPDMEPFTPGTIKMEYNDWQDALTMFYEQFGWDAKLGCPTRETLEKFDLADVADELAAKNLLP